MRRNNKKQLPCSELLNRRQVAGLGMLAAAAAHRPLRSGKAPAVPLLTPTYLRCEYRQTPLGIGERKPRLSWQLVSENPAERGQEQAAYEILVSRTKEEIAADRGGLWSSGKVVSSQTSQIEYDGKQLNSRQECWWKVRSYNHAGQPGPWSEPARWTVGLLRASDWTADWIGFDEYEINGVRTAQDAPLIRFDGLKWTRVPHGLWKFNNVTWESAPGTAPAAGSPKVYFRRRFHIPPGRPIRRATFLLTCDDSATIYINGHPSGRAFRWELATLADITAHITPGWNAGCIEISQQDGYPPSAQGRIVVEFSHGELQIIPVDATWKTALTAPGEWQSPDFDDSHWPAAEEMNQPLWGTPSQAGYSYTPARYLRTEFRLDEPVKRATLYATALGLYAVRINGRQVAEDFLTPGWTDYHKRVYYQTYDVTGLLLQGHNAIGAILGDGWFAGNIGFSGRRHYGGLPRIGLQLDIELADGSSHRVITDEKWTAACGPLRYNDIYAGCCMDSRIDIHGWDQPGFNAKGWSAAALGLRSTTGPAPLDVTTTLRKAVRDNMLLATVSNSLFGKDPAPNSPKVLKIWFAIGSKDHVVVVPENQEVAIGQPNKQLHIIRAIYLPAGTKATGPNPRIQAAPADPVRVTQTLSARVLTEPQPGLHTYDMGQNMVGWVRMKVSGQPGQKIVIRHGEMKNPDGTIYTSNLRGAMATDIYYLKGGEELLEPMFTFHGFRYVEVRGLSASPKLTDLEGVVIHSHFRRTGHFTSSSPAINQLYSNIVWSQRGNHVSIPTDCPQRDERLGWTGDTQFFIPTGVMNFDVSAFFTSWLVTLCQDSQSANGSFADVAPSVWGNNGVTAWGDAALICTHQIYRTYGDTRIIRRHYAAMRRYFKYPASLTRNGIMTAQGFGDWLNMGGGASMQVIGTAYYAMLAGIMAEMASAIGQTSDADGFAQLHKQLKRSFASKLILPDGKIAQSSQTGFALAFTMGLVPDNLRPKAARQFAADIQHRDWHLATGFIGTPRLLPALNIAGRNDIAYKLLFQTSMPSWLYQVKTGGSTTMWERWNGWSKSSGFAPITMNSFNHYAFGAVGQYLYRNIAGIQDEQPGYRRILLCPVPGRGLAWARGEYESISGKIACGWKLRHGILTVDVEIPVNTTARLVLPSHTPDQVTEGGRPVDQASGVRLLARHRQSVEMDLQSGSYHFQTHWNL